MARIAAAAGIVIAGEILIATAAVIILAVEIDNMVGVINQIKEDFKEKLINWASTNSLSSHLPPDNCNRENAPVINKVVGWTQCNYICSRGSTGAVHIERFMPSEFGCPTPVPCAPGLTPNDPRKDSIRIMYRDKIPLSYLMCQGLDGGG